MYNRLRMDDKKKRNPKLENVGIQRSFDKTDVTHLFHAIQRGKVRLTRFIIEAAEGKLQNSRDSDGKTPLIFTCMLKEERTRAELVRLLLDKHADVNLKDADGRTALSYACEKRCNDIVNMLIHIYNIDPDAVDKKGNTPLIYCAKQGNDVAIEILIKCFRRLGLKVDHVNNEGFSALLESARNSHLTCAKILAIQGRAHRTVRDRQNGRTAFEWFMAQGYDKKDLGFLQVTSKFVRAVKLTSILKSKTFGSPKPSAVSHKIRHARADAGKHERQNYKHGRSKSLMSRPVEHARGKSKYRKQRSVENAPKVLVSHSGPITVTTVISTVTSIANLSLGTTENQVLDDISVQSVEDLKTATGVTEEAEKMGTKKVEETVALSVCPSCEKEELFLNIVKLDS
ncbi:hypothetical protein SNE40_011084 [Patella caerulea]|uniref:Uncharacterized protein n=1 Tax=Patella caerulea TaxID=87958 RepID=A0AAN8K3D2_PATCE